MTVHHVTVNYGRATLNRGIGSVTQVRKISR